MKYLFLIVITISCCNYSTAQEQTKSKVALEFRDRDGILKKLSSSLQESRNAQKELVQEQKELKSSIFKWREEQEQRTGAFKSFLKNRESDHKGLIASARENLRLAREERIEARKEREGFWKRLQNFTPGQAIAWRLFWLMIPIGLILGIVLIMLMFVLSLLLKIKKATGL